MNEKARVSHPTYGLLPTDVDGVDALAELALGRLRLLHGSGCGPPVIRLYDAGDSALRRRCDFLGKRTNPVATMISPQATI